MRALIIVTVTLVLTTAASGETSTYVFVPDQSELVQTGGIASVHWTYSVEGHFELTIDPNAGTASFTRVDANATDDSPFKRTLDPNHVFNMTSLVGTVLEDATINFTGKASDGSDILITVAFIDDLAHLIGQTTPPPHTADFFIFDLDAVGQRKYGGGTGTPEDPYQIWDANDMQAIGADANDWDKCFVLMADIDLGQYQGQEYNIIGSGVCGNSWCGSLAGTPFTGVFDGNGHVIRNLTYTSTGSTGVGLFGYFEGAVKNLGVVDVNISVAQGRVIGGLVGFLEDSADYILNCYVTGNISGEAKVGGLIGGTGRETDADTDDCYSRAVVQGREYVGGLLGYNDGRPVRCYSFSIVEGDTAVGGLVGCNASDARLVDCYAGGIVSGDTEVGGLVGKASCDIDDCEGGVIVRCYSVAKVEATGTKIGGLVGASHAMISQSYWGAEASGLENMCGFARPVFAVGCDDSNGLSTAQMMQQSSFEGWDFINVWGIGENQTYPYLRKYSAADINEDESVNFGDLAILADNWLASIAP